MWVTSLELQTLYLVMNEQWTRHHLKCVWLPGAKVMAVCIPCKISNSLLWWMRATQKPTRHSQWERRWTCHHYATNHSYSRPKPHFAHDLLQRPRGKCQKEVKGGMHRRLCMAAAAGSRNNPNMKSAQCIMQQAHSITCGGPGWRSLATPRGNWN